MNHYVYLLYFLFGSTILNAQSIPLSKSHPKTMMVEKVYRNLLAVARNQQTGTIPSIQVVQRKKNTAAYSPYSNTIKIEEPAYDLCASFGEYGNTALAILIAHEYIHFSKKHHGINGFACDYYSNTESLAHGTMEEEADFWGLFTAYLAGYDVMKVAPDLLNAIYRHYEFAENMAGYPPLQIRKQLGISAIKKIEEYIQLYEAGNYLIAIGGYEEASYCYGTILQEYQSVELHNNMGLSLLYQALTIAPKSDYPFLYPVELDINSRLYRYQKPPFGFDPKKLAQSYLQKAIQQFNAAIRLDPAYFSAKLNLAAAYEMLGQMDLAKNTVLSINNQHLSNIQQQHLWILKGIIAAREQQLTNSREFFQEANDHAIAQLNLKILNGFSPPNAKDLPNMAITIDLDDVGDLRRINNFTTTIPLNNQLSSDYYQPKYQFEYQAFPHSVAWKIKRLRKMEQSILQVTKSPIAFTSEGLHIGSPLTDIKRLLGEEGIYTTTATGQFLHFPNKGLIFLLNDKNIVVQWGKFVVIGK